MVAAAPRCAVSPICNRQSVHNFRRARCRQCPAEFNSAIRQITNLRYAKTHTLSLRGEGVQARSSVRNGWMAKRFCHQIFCLFLAAPLRQAVWHCVRTAIANAARFESEPINLRHRMVVLNCKELHEVWDIATYGLATIYGLASPLYRV